MLSSNSDIDDFIKIGGVTCEMCVILQNAALFRYNASASFPTLVTAEEGKKHLTVCRSQIIIIIKHVITLLLYIFIS